MYSRYEKFTERARRAMGAAQDEAMRNGEDHITPRHIAIGILSDERSIAHRALVMMGIDAGQLRQDIRRERSEGSGRVQLGMDEEAQGILLLAVEAAVKMLHTWIGTEHLLMGLIQDGRNPLSDQLFRREVGIEQAQEAILEAIAQPAGR